MSSHPDLVAAAVAASSRAYAPYSHYFVGAALRGDNGKIYSGANVENASYGLCICAERAAIIAAVLDGVRTIEAIAVATSTSPPAAPCGMCRQTIAEFAREAALILTNDRGERLDMKLSELLPHAFHREDIK